MQMLFDLKSRCSVSGFLRHPKKESDPALRGLIPLSQIRSIKESDPAGGI